MARTGKAPAEQAPDLTLYQFTKDFFTLFGAHLDAPNSHSPQTLRVQLPPELTAHFGQECLSLCFQSTELLPDHELVAHGSRAFDRMLAFLAQRSAFTVQRLPRRVGGGEVLMQAIRPLNASIHDLRIQEQVQLLFFFTWRITYRADDKRQELYSVVLSEDGTRLAQRGEPNAPADAVDTDLLLADAEPVVPERNEEGHLLPPRLLPLAQLVKLSETARKYAIYHADLRCVAHEAEIMPRLHKTLNRLTTYYQQQIEEVYDSHDPEGEKRRTLELDLQRKVAEEVENHRLRVQVELLSYLALEVPTAVLELTLTDGRQQAPVRVVQNRYSGLFRRPACHACGADVVTATLDRSGHVICDNCVEQCHTCQSIVCSRCGFEPCPVCGEDNCTVCGQICWACGGRACPDHNSRCPTCGDLVCHACQTACAHCGVRQCRNHLIADCVGGEGDAIDLICAGCAVRCPGCRQYTAQTSLCDASGQRFCRNCLVTCAGCGRSVGPGFYQVSPVDRQPYCQTCMRECPSCGRVSPVVVACHVCGIQGCPVCTARCVVCREYFCAGHRHTVEECGHAVCASHQTTCAIGREAICPACSVPCAICDRLFCGEHARVCAQCGQEYCMECVRTSGLCDTCAMVAKHGEPVDVRQHAWASRPDVVKLAPYYQWLHLSNERYTIYFGEGSMMSAAVIVVDNTGGEQVVRTRRITAVERLRGMLGL